MFEQMKRDAAQRKFDRLLIWKVSHLGRDMREVIATVYELADLGVSVLPIKSQTGPINSTMGRLLWAIQAWFAEMENDERSEAIRAGHARARTAGKQIGRPRKVFRRDLVDQQELPFRGFMVFPSMSFVPQRHLYTGDFVKYTAQQRGRHAKVF